MRRDSETGEFELVLGNGQLLSGLFIVVLLFAVFFALGYVVGQNSPRSARLTEAGAAVPSDRPQPAQPAAPPAAAVETPAQPADGNAAAPQETTTMPAATTPDSGAAAAPATESEEPPPGSYWQVMALKQGDAEVVVHTLKDKGFPARMAPGRNNLTLVLVGPYSDVTAMSKAKADLENAGFHPIKK